MPKIDRFGGIAPKIDPRLLPSGKARVAVNCRTSSGKLEPFKFPLEVATPSKQNPLSIYKLRYNGVDHWLNWLQDVDVARSPVVGDTLNRLYFTGAAEPRVTTPQLATSGTDKPTVFYTLGVPSPKVAPSVAVVGGSGAQETRVYAYAYVDPWGQPGQLSPLTSVTGPANATSWNLSNMETGPTGGGSVTNVSSSAGVTTFTLGANETRYLRVGEEVQFSGVHASLNGFHILTEVTATTVKATTGSTHSGAVSGTWTRAAPWVPGTWKQRIYRSDSEGQLRLVAEQNAAATYVDSIPNSALSIQVLESEDWAMPPANLKALRLSPQGFMIGISGNDVYMSEPFKPWAWPSQYIRPVPFEPVGLGVFGSLVVIPTVGVPYMMLGAHPENMQPDLAASEPMPCTAKRSIVQMNTGVVWDTPLGLASCNNGGAALVTREAFEDEHWAPCRPLFAGTTNERYVGFNTERGIYVDAKSGDVSYLSIIPTAAFTDPETTVLYLVLGGKIVEWDAGPDPMIFDWWSGTITTPAPVNIGAAQVAADYTTINDSTAAAQLALDLAANNALLAITSGYPNSQSSTQGDVNGAMVGSIPANGSLLVEGWSYSPPRGLTFILYANDKVHRTKTCTNRFGFLCKGGNKESEFSVRLIGNVRVDRVEFDMTLERLRTK